MQHDGWLETYLQSRFPNHDLVFRNLGFLGRRADDPAPLGQLRHPRPMAHRTKADVIFAFFGYNESFARRRRASPSSRRTSRLHQAHAGPEVQRQGAPRLVLFSPIAHENLHDRNLPDGAENNKRLELYTDAMAEVAKANNVPFVDLFHPTRDLLREGRQAADDQRHPPDRAGQPAARRDHRPGPVRRQPAPKRDPEALEKLRQAVLDKNFIWFNRYRTVDGYSIYGGRADLKFVGGQTNRVVMQREMEVLDVMTANRDKRDLGRRAGRRPQGR